MPLGPYAYKVFPSAGTHIESGNALRGGCILQLTIPAKPSKINHCRDLMMRWVMWNVVVFLQQRITQQSVGIKKKRNLSHICQIFLVNFFSHLFWFNQTMWETYSTLCQSHLKLTTRHYTHISVSDRPLQGDTSSQDLRKHSQMGYTCPSHTTTGGNEWH